MKARCVRWDGDGNPTWPLWDGSAWSWRDGDGNKVRPPQARALVKPEGYFVIGCWYNDDGSSPDPKLPFMQHPLRISRYTGIGREYPLSEVQADIDHWLSVVMPKEIERRLANLARKPKDSSRFAAVEAIRLKAED